MISAWHIVISGFSQRLGQTTGCQRLWMDLGCLRSDTTVVEFRPWDSDWGDLAELVKIASDPLPMINVYAYSWGAGYGAIQLARQLRRRQLVVDRAVFADPVYHAKTLVGRMCAHVLAYCPCWRITIPDNVLSVKSTIQRTSLLHGHRLRAENPSRTKIHKPIRVVADHRWMDDSPEFCQLVMEAAGLE